MIKKSPTSVIHERIRNFKIYACINYIMDFGICNLDVLIDEREKNSNFFSEK